jgi:hypothetical protein
LANAIFPKYKEAILQSAANSNMSSGTVKVALVDTDTYSYNAAHEFLSSVSGRVGTDQTIGSKTFTNGVFDGDNVTFPAVSGASAEALLIYIDTGTAGTSRLIAFIDTGVTGLPVVPNGGDITVTFNASGIFAL